MISIIFDKLIKLVWNTDRILSDRILIADIVCAIFNAAISIEI